MWKHSKTTISFTFSLQPRLSRGGQFYKGSSKKVLWEGDIWLWTSMKWGNQTKPCEGKKVLRAEGRVKYKKSAGKNERIRDFKKAVFLKWKWPMDKRAGRKFRSQQRARPYMCALGSFVQSLMGIHCLWWVGEWQDLDLLLFLIF